MRRARRREGILFIRSAALPHSAQYARPGRRGTSKQRGQMPTGLISLIPRLPFIIVLMHMDTIFSPVHMAHVRCRLSLIVSCLHNGRNGRLAGCRLGQMT